MALAVDYGLLDPNDILLEVMMANAAVKIIEHTGRIELHNGDREYVLRKSKGWVYLLELLRHPGEFRYAQALVAAEHPVPQEYCRISEFSETELQGLNLHIQCDTRRMEMIDQRCIKEVSARLNHLIGLEAELREGNNLAALEDLLSEKDQLSQYLAECLRRDGRMRYFCDGSYKAVSSVNKALRRCLDGIVAVDPALGHYLKKQVRVWHRLMYEPAELEIEVWAG
jgi:hypothetical protein